ncbi:hypothetical protein GGR58DRAFT_509128 [Xylaria digitata]|nr:hypothetical protein GGR58DRAFT_509128 [Xylaria digitata]
MASQEYQVVPYFDSLPAELRQMIWKESVLAVMENPEVLIIDPQSVGTSAYIKNSSLPFPLVNIGFPAAMHVNRESRDIALFHLNMVDLSPYPWKKCPVPQRCFRPEIDTLYSARSVVPQLDFSKEEIAKVQHLAIDLKDTFVVEMSYFFGYTFLQMPALRTLRLVLPTAREAVDLGFRPLCVPDRRCALRPIGADRLDRVQIFSHNLHLYSNHHFTSRYFPINLRTPSKESGYTPLYLKEALEVIRRIAYNVMDWDRREGAEKRREALERLTIEACYITEFCYSPSGDSRFVALGEDFPDSPDPSIFAINRGGRFYSVW